MFEPPARGKGACEINPACPREFYAQCAMLLIGSSVWAYVIGSACGIIATLDPANIEYRQTMDELNFFARDQRLPTDLQVKLRSYFRNTLYLFRSRRYDALLGKMSQKLRGDAAYRVCEFRLRRVPYLVAPGLEPEFMSNLAIKCVSAVYSHLERVPCTRLFIVERGVVAKRGKLGLSGSSFGALARTLTLAHPQPQPQPWSTSPPLLLQYRGHPLELPCTCSLPLYLAHKPPCPFSHLACFLLLLTRLLHPLPP